MTASHASDASPARDDCRPVEYATMRTIDPVEHIRRNPERYVPAGRVEPEYLAERLAEDARILGARAVQTRQVGGWWVVAADFDWVGDGTSSGAPDVFSNVVAFPEAGVNSMRSEILLTAFADDVVTSDGTSTQVVKTSGTAAPHVRDFVPHGPWRRVVAFRISTPQP